MKSKEKYLSDRHQCLGIQRNFIGFKDKSVIHTHVAVGTTQGAIRYVHDGMNYS
jgi:hypothetical protein